jgi:hypothetical protein
VAVSGGFFVADMLRRASPEKGLRKFHWGVTSLSASQWIPWIAKEAISVASPIMQGLQPTYEYVAQQRPDIWNHKPEAFMDSSFIAKLEKTGFIKNLAQPVAS